MTEILLYILSLLTAPIQKFWIKAEGYKASREYGKMVVAFATSILIVFGMIITLLAIIYLVFTYCFELLLVVGVITWIYWAVYQKMHASSKATETDNELMEDMSKLLESGRKGYVPMRSIVYQISKRSANDIMAKVPRTLGEIEVYEDKFIVENGIVFYQFQLSKSDIKYECTMQDLHEFKIILQTTFEALWQGGNFPQIALQIQTDEYGNMYDPVVIDRIDDIGHKYLIQTVFVTKNYMSQIRNNELNGEYQQEALYDPTDSNFL